MQEAIWTTGTEDGASIIDNLNVKPYERPTWGTINAPVMPTPTLIGLGPQPTLPVAPIDERISAPTKGMWGEHGYAGKEKMKQAKQ